MAKAESTTVNGKEYSRDDFLELIGGDVQVFDDLELVADLDALAEGNGLKIAPVFKRLMGARYKSVLEDLRNPETGRVSIEDASNFVMALLTAVSPNS